MTLVSGDYAGIIFCNASADTYYLFRLGVDGSYSLLLMSQANSDGVSLATGSVSVNLSQPNLIAAVVSGGSIGLYVNRQLITSVNDSTYSHGRIAVFSWNAALRWLAGGAVATENTGKALPRENEREM